MGKKVIISIISSIFLTFAVGLHQNQKTVVCINDGLADWTAVETVKIYSGSIIEPVLTITDSQEIDQLVQEATDVKSYRIVPSRKYLEGMNGIWVEFDNGVSFGMYRNENYGNISTEMTVIGQPPYYYFPKKFRAHILEYIRN